MLFFYDTRHYIYTTGISFNHDRSYSEQLSIDVFRYLIGLVGSVSVIGIIKILTPQINKVRVVPSLLSLSGRETLQIYILQNFFFLAWTKIVERVPADILNSISIVVYYLLTAITIVFFVSVLAIMLHFIKIKTPGFEKVLFWR